MGISRHPLKASPAPAFAVEFNPRVRHEPAQAGRRYSDHEPAPQGHCDRGVDLRALVKQAFGSPRASMFLTDVGKAYRETAAAALDAANVPRKALHGRLEVSVVAYPPDERIRDLSNLWKSALDILQHNHVIENDGHFDRELIERAHKVKGGSFVVTISEIAQAFESRQQGFDLSRGAQAS